jgi:ABC-type polysaccharide/polyol phosphate transport system ATPase subunit
MSGQSCIDLRRVSKSFSHHTGRTLLRNHVAGWFGRASKQRFYALRDITFRIERGESVAVVGGNGAGKSTLLSVVAGLARPDSGEVAVNGLMIPLLELGSGFHYDLTGAENVRMNASLLGLTRRRTAELFDDILEFAGIADFIDEPIRTYSTGMVLRLAFSVAVNMDPDILIIDEVLAVGDQAFQAKCFDKIFEFKRSGRTLLCVSHAAGTVKQLCDRALWLDHGELVMDGAITEVMDAYTGRVPSG